MPHKRKDQGQIKADHGLIFQVNSYQAIMSV